MAIEEISKTLLEWNPKDELKNYIPPEVLLWLDRTTQDILLNWFKNDKIKEWLIQSLKEEAPIENIEIIKNILSIFNLKSKPIIAERTKIISDRLSGVDILAGVDKEGILAGVDYINGVITFALSFLDEEQKRILEAQTKATLDSLTPDKDGNIIYKWKPVSPEIAKSSLEADYLVVNYSALVSAMNENKKDEFTKSIEWLKKLGFWSTYSKDKHEVMNQLQFDPSVPKDVRARNTEAVSAILKDSNKAEGYRFNDGSMLIRYEDRNGQDRELIVTWYWVMKKRREWVTIETNLLDTDKKLNQEPQKKVEEWTKETLKRKWDFLTSIDTYFWTELSKAIKDEDQWAINTKQTMIEYHRVIMAELSMPVDTKNADSIKKKIDQLNNIGNIWDIGISWPIEMRWEEKWKSLKQIRDELLAQIRSPLNEYSKSLTDQLQNVRKLEEVKKNNPFQESMRNFDATAESNLSFLIDLGYDKLGQSTLERVVDVLNREYRWIGGHDYVDLSREPLDHQQKQRILLALTRLMHTTGRWLMPEWDQVNNDDPAISYRQTRSPLWGTQLVALWKKPSYQQLIQSPDTTRFQDRIIWREKPTEQSRGL